MKKVGFDPPAPVKNQKSYHGQTEAKTTRTPKPQNRNEKISARSMTTVSITDESGRHMKSKAHKHPRGDVELRQDWATLGSVEPFEHDWTETFFDLTFVAILIHICDKAIYLDLKNSADYMKIVFFMLQWALMINNWMDLVQTENRFEHLDNDLIPGNRYTWVACFMVLFTCMSGSSVDTQIEQTKNSFYVYLALSKVLHLVNLYDISKIRRARPYCIVMAIVTVIEIVLMLVLSLPFGAKIYTIEHPWSWICVVLVWAVGLIKHELPWRTWVHRCLGATKTIAIPLNLHHLTSRYNEMVMLMIGEGVITIMVTDSKFGNEDLIDTIEYMVTMVAFFVCLLLLGVLMFSSQEEELDALEHVEIAPDKEDAEKIRKKDDQMVAQLEGIVEHAKTIAKGGSNWNMRTTLRRELGKARKKLRQNHKKMFLSGKLGKTEGSTIEPNYSYQHAIRKATPTWRHSYPFIYAHYLLWMALVLVSASCKYISKYANVSYFSIDISPMTDTACEDPHRRRLGETPTECKNRRMLEELYPDLHRRLGGDDTADTTGEKEHHKYIKELYKYQEAGSCFLPKDTDTTTRRRLGGGSTSYHICRFIGCRGTTDHSELKGTSTPRINCFNTPAYQITNADSESQLENWFNVACVGFGTSVLLIYAIRGSHSWNYPKLWYITVLRSLLVLSFFLTIIWNTYLSPMYLFVSFAGYLLALFGTDYLNGWMNESWKEEHFHEEESDSESEEHTVEHSRGVELEMQDPHSATVLDPDATPKEGEPKAKRRTFMTQDYASSGMTLRDGAMHG